MKTYVVTYDLNRSGQNYECITQKLRAYGNFCHLQGSVWLIWTNQSAAQVRDNLQACLDTNDELYVGGLTGEAAWYNVNDKQSAWLKTPA